MPFSRAERIARTEINRALRNAAYQQYQTSRVVTGYRRMCYPPTACLACLALDGEYSPMSAGVLSDHPNGKCSMIPWRDPNKPPDWQTGRQWFEEQTEEDQRRIMGAGRFELWKQGADLRSMVYLKESPVWGGQPAVKTLEQIRMGAKMSDAVSSDGGGSVLKSVLGGEAETTGAMAPVYDEVGKFNREAALDGIKSRKWFMDLQTASEHPQEVLDVLEAMPPERLEVFYNKTKGANVSFISDDSSSQRGFDVKVNINKYKETNDVIGKKSNIEAFFHEMSHYIDWSTTNGDKSAFYGISGGAELSENLSEETLAFFNKLTKEVAKEFDSWEDVKIYPDSAKIANFAIRWAFDDKDEELARLGNKLGTPYYSVFTDMVSGFSDGKIWEGFGHRAGYWAERDETAKTNEFAAGAGEAFFVGGLREKAMMEIFPKSYGIIKERLLKK